MADLKTLDTGNLEVRMVADAAADAVVISGLAPTSTIEKAIREARKTGIYSVIDMLNVKDPVELLKSLAVKPEVVELHRAIDLENTSALGLDMISEIKALSDKILVAVAGGVRVDKLKPTDQTIDDALQAGADIIVVGRDITKAKDVRLKTEQFLERMKKPEIDQYRVMTDF